MINDWKPLDYIQTKITEHIGIAPPTPPRPKDIVFRRHQAGNGLYRGEYRSKGFAFLDSTLIVREVHDQYGRLFAPVYHLGKPAKDNMGFYVLFSRGTDSRESISVAIIPILLDGIAEQIHESGITWYGDDPFQRGVPLAEMAMDAPTNEWVFDDLPDPFPVVYVRIDRVPFDEERSYVDVVDLLVLKRQRRNAT